MTSELDLNINNYNIHDIENFFGLFHEYNFNDVINNEKKILNILISENNYDSEKKTEIINFIKSSRDRLINNLKKTTDIQNNGFIENYDKLIIEKDENNVINKISTITNGNSFVQNKETTSFNEITNPNKYLNPIEAYPTNISRSYLNNLKRKTITQTLILNSLYREDYYNTLSTDFTILLPMYIKNVLSIRLSSLQLPNVIYSISKQNKNNALFLREDVVGGVEGVVIIPDGDYDSSSFITVLQNEIQTQLGVSNFDVTLDINTQKITISNNVPYQFTLNFFIDIDNYDNTKTKYILNENYKTINCVDITELYKRLGWIMGYRKSEYSGNTKYETEGIFNSAYTNYIYFSLNDYNNSQSQNIIGIFPNNIIGNNIIAMIPLNAKIFNVCFNNGADFLEKKREYFGPINLQKMRIQILNQYGEILDLNNMDFSFSLELELGYDW
jgi:hypothetical protein